MENNDFSVTHVTIYKVIKSTLYNILLKRSLNVHDKPLDRQHLNENHLSYIR